MTAGGIPHHHLGPAGVVAAAASCIAAWISACGPSDTFRTPSYSQQAYVKASNTFARHHFGSSVALSADGSTLAVGAYDEASGDPKNESDRSLLSSGAVYMFTRTDMTWKQKQYLKASPITVSALFGSSVAVSGDGLTVAIGAPRESPGRSGAVYVFAGRDGVWAQQVRLAAALNRNEQFGISVALSVDGATLAVGAPGPGQTDAEPPETGANDPGMVHVYRRTGTAWSGPAIIKADVPGMGNQFGYSVALSGNGSTLAVGACGPCQSDGGVKDAGAVYVFTSGGSGWVQSPPLRASQPDLGDLFGYSVALSDDGATLAVGAYQEDGPVDDPASNSTMDGGAVYVFTRGASPSTWNQPAYVKADTTTMANHFGHSVALSPDGQRLAVGAPGESSKSTGVDNEDMDHSASHSGAAYVFTRNGETWRQSSYLKASNTSRDAALGQTIALSRDGSTVAVGAFEEGGKATGVDPDPAPIDFMKEGAAYVFEKFSGPRQTAARARGGDAVGRTALP